MKTYTTFSTRKTAQSEAIPGEAQVLNNAGGYVYRLDDWKAFERFLILGSEGGTYYVREQKLTRENATRTMNVIAQDGRRAVDQIVKVSDEGRAPKNDPAIFALALAAAAPDPATRAYALANLPKVCRIPTHLFHFCTYVRQFRGVGRGLKRALQNWYNETPTERLAYEAVKYQSRDGWSNADVLRIAHPKTTDVARNAVYKWIVDAEVGEAVPDIVRAFSDAQGLKLDTKLGELELARLIRKYNLSREMLPTEALTKPEVWEALLERMPYTAMIRNLGNMSKCGLLKPLSATSKTIVERLHDQEALKRARIHPVAVLLALRTYEAGRGLRGSGEWTPVPAVVDALDDAFYLAFKQMEPTGKRLLFGVDVSGSMSWGTCAGAPITAAEGAAAMALACAKLEKEYYIMGFADRFRDLGITAKMTLKQALAQTSSRNFGATDCAVPMAWALKNKVQVDGFIVITDNETWAGRSHPKQTLREYREKMGIQSKQIVMGMTATEFSIADPKDPLALDVAGFDASVPQAIGEFLR